MKNTFFKSISRSELKVAFSYGYNPTMKISMGIALPLFCESSTELVDMELLENYDTEFVQSELSRVLPKESQVLEVKQIAKSDPSIDQTVCWAEYKIKLFNPHSNPLPLEREDNTSKNDEIAGILQGDTERTITLE